MPECTSDLPWVNKRGDTYYVFWYDIKAQRTERKTLGTKDPLEARKRLAEFLGAEPDLGTASRLTVAEVVDAYIHEHLRVNAVAGQRFEAALAHIRAFFGAKYVSDLTPEMCRSYTEARKAGIVTGFPKRVKKGSLYRPAKVSTIALELSALRFAINHAVKRKRLSTDAKPLLEFPKVPKKETDFLDELEIAQLIKATENDPTLHDFIVLAYYTGARRESIWGLKKDQVDLKTGTLRLRPHGRAETAKRKPVVRIFPPMHEILVRRLRESPNEYIFDRSVDIYYRFKQACLKLGFKGRSHPHILRHSRASNLLLAGEDIYKVAKLLGDRVDTVDATYGHLKPDHMRFTSDEDLDRKLARNA